MKKDLFENKLSIIYIFIMFLIYPVFTRGNYFNITETKWTFFSVATGLFIILWVCSRITDGKWFVRYDNQILLELILLLILVSSILSPYGNVVWTGLSARYTGAIFMILVIVACMCIANSELKNDIEKIFALIAVGAVLIALWSMLNFVGVDIFGMHQGMAEIQIRKFMSGIGNIVFLGSFYAITVPMIFLMYIKSLKTKWNIFYLVALMISALGVYVCGTDGGLLAIFILQFLILPISVQNVGEVKKYVLGMCIMMVSGVFAEALGMICSYETVAFDQIMTIIFSFRGFWIGLVICIFVEILLHFNEKNVSVSKFKIAYYVMMCIGILLIFVRIENVRLFFNFGDNWGTDRGFMWIKAGEIFREEPILRKILGNGGDTFNRLLIEYVGSNIGVNGQAFDNVHCEYLQWLISYGLVGAVVYCFMLAKIIWQLFKDFSDKNKLVIAAGICGYSIQAITGLNQVFTTPLFWILCGLGMMYTRKEKKIGK